MSKGSIPRPMKISQGEYGKRWEKAFAHKCPGCGKIHGADSLHCSQCEEREKVKKSEPEIKQLVLGAGRYKKRRIIIGDENYKNAVSLDINGDLHPDVIWDLNVRPLPFNDNEFDEIHAYDVLEHIGKQGDWKGFFEEWNEYYRIIKPDGLFFITAPMYNSIWAWSDPGHTRVISKELFIFLDQSNYENEESQMTDYRKYYKGNFKFEKNVTPHNEKNIGAYILRAVK